MPTSPRQPDLRRCPVAADVQSVGAARRFAAAALDGWDRGDLVDTVALLVSEVVTNVVLHAGTPGELVIERRDGSVRIEVHDGAGQMPQRKAYGDEASTGRGLALVELLADDWGADPTDAGKCVWFEVGSPSLGVDDEPTPAIDIVDPPAAPAGRRSRSGAAGGPRRARHGVGALVPPAGAGPTAAWP